MPLRPMIGVRAFAKWGIDFVGPINPAAYRTGSQYIIAATNYLTRWVEAKATRKNDARTTVVFLFEYIFIRYGLPIEIVSDRGTHFINKVIEHLLNEFMVVHRKFAPYHPQGNGQAESTNKILCTTNKGSGEFENQLGAKVAFCTLGLQGCIQDRHWSYSVQHGLWLRCNSTYGVSTTYA